MEGLEQIVRGLVQRGWTRQEIHAAVDQIYENIIEETAVTLYQDHTHTGDCGRRDSHTAPDECAVD